MVRRLDAVDPRHANVEQHDVRLRLDGEPYGFLAVAGLGDHLVFVELADQLPQAVAGGLLVVNDQDFHRPVTPRPSREGSAG